MLRMHPPTQCPSYPKVFCSMLLCILCPLQCSLPLTGRSCVDVIITEMCVFEIDKEARELVLTEVCEGLTVEDIRAKTDADFKVADDLKTVAYA